MSSNKISSVILKDLLLSGKAEPQVQRYRTFFKPLETFLLQLECLRKTDRFIFVYGREVLLVTTESHKLIDSSQCIEMPYCVGEVSHSTLGIGYQHYFELFEVSANFVQKTQQVRVETLVTAIGRLPRDHFLLATEGGNLGVWSLLSLSEVSTQMLPMDYATTLSRSGISSTLVATSSGGLHEVKLRRKAIQLKMQSLDRLST